MRAWTLTAVVLLVAFFAAALFAQEEGEQAVPEQGVGGSDFHKNDITYSTEVVTPHVAWAAKLPGGPIKGFFIPSVEFGRDMIELMERLDLEPTTVSIDRNWDTNCWGIGDYYGHEFRGDIDDFRIVYNYVEKDLTGPADFDVMVIPGLNGWSRMTAATRDAILKRVEEGAGLVLIHPFVGDIKGHPFAADPIKMSGAVSAAGDETPIRAYETDVDARIWDVSPLVNCPDDFVSDRGYPQINYAATAKGKWEAVQNHFITAGLPMELLLEGNVGGTFYKYEAKGDVLVKSGDYPIVAVKTFGKGRVVAFAYMEEGFIPQAQDLEQERIYWPYWEYYYSLLAKSVMWAAGRTGDLDIVSLAAKDDDPALTMTLTSSAPRKVEIEITGANEFGQALGSYKGAKDLVEGANVVSIAAGDLRPSYGWPGGREIFDVIIRDAASGGTLNWGSAVFEVSKKATLVDVRPSADVYRRGETLSAVMHAAGDLSGVSLRFIIKDDLDRIVASKTESTRGEKYFSCPLKDFVGRYAFLTVELVDSNGAVIDQLSYKPILVVQDERRPREYVALVSFGGGRPYFTSVRMKQVRAAGADTGFTWGGTVDNGLRIPRGAFGIYWYDRGPTSDEAMDKAIASYEKTGDFDSLQYLTKKELYRRTGDKKFLTRVPCFNDPEYMAMLRNIVYGVARSKALYNLDYYFVGDEGSLTSYSDPYDYCWGPHTLAAFREWLKTQYASLDALNAEWKADYKRWEDVVPVTTEVAQESGNFAPWADHRTFMEITFADAYKTVRDGVTAGDPEGHIAVSGTQATTAYDGCDWYRLDQVIDDFLSYDGGNQWDLHRSFAKPGSMIGFWTGYGSRGIAVQNAIWTAAIHNVLYPNIFWMFSYLNPDFTYSASARDMGTAFKALKFEGVGKLFMESARQQDGIALHWSIASAHATSITNNQGERGRKEVKRDFSADRDGWVRAIKDIGLQFDFVAYEQIEKGKLASGEYKTFVMPFSMAVSPKEVAEIKAFAENGGVVIADAAAALMDDHCAWQGGGGLLNEFFGIETAASDKRELAGSTIFGETWRDRTRTPGITGDVTVTPEGASWGLNAEDLAGIEAVEAGVKAAGATALVKVGETDAVIVRPVGKGWAVYLNVLVDRYGGGGRRQQQQGPTGENYRALVKAVLAHSGVSPAIEILGADGKHIARAQVARYRFGDSIVLAAVKENIRLEAATGMDGVTTYKDAEVGEIAKQAITVRLPAQYYVTDVRTGEKLGKTDTVNTQITIGGALVLGLSPEENGITLTGPASAALGEHPVFMITSTRQGKHLVRCHFYAPDGTFLHNYAANVLFDGATGGVTLPSALNDAPGVYTLKATDVVTGSTAEAKIRLQ